MPKTLKKFLGKVCECLRCGHVWMSRVEKPICCPKCKQTSWQTEAAA